MPRFSLSSLALPALFAAALTAGCGGGGGNSPPPPAPTPPAPAPVPPPATPTAEVAVTVADTSGRFVDAATITVVSSGTTAATNAQGAATVRVPVGSEQVLRIAKAGFAEQVQLLRLEAGATQGFLRTMLVAREPAVAINAIEGGGSATGRDGVKVEFPPGALVNAGGQAVTGRIDMVMTPLNTARADVRAFPGSFEGTAPGVARSPIVTFGTSELVPQQNGQKLNLAPNRSATIELPMYARTELDGTPIRPGDRIPLWSLNASTGLWVQEGEGTVIAQPASPTGLAMRASISHFSWWNVDRFAERGTVNVTVRVVGSNVPANTRAWLEAQVVSGNGPTSAATTSVTVGNATQLPVATPGTLRFTASFDTPTESCFGSTTASVARGVTTDVTVNMTCVTAPVPTIIEPTGLTSTNSSDPTRVQIQVDGRQPDQVQLLANGTAVATFGPQFFYVHQLNTASLPEGTVSLTARATLGTLNRTSPPVSLRIDRTAPTITGFTPATTTPVTRATQFVVDFSEPVNALPFTLADAVRLTVTLPGQSTPTPIAANVELNTAGTRLTVTPNAELTIGTVGLSWGGLRDAAGNTITGTLGASWPVARAQVFAADLASNITDGFGTQTGLATVLFRADGSLLAMHQPLPSNNVQLARFDRASNTWVTASPPANDRPVPTNVHIAAMALDGNDVPHVAFAQSRTTDATRVELVLKRFVNGAWEALAPPLPLAGERLFDSTPGQLAFDAQGRPVVAFADPNLSQLQVLRLENGALVSIGDSRFVQLSADISLQRGPDGALWMSYTEGRFGANGSLLRVARFDGTWSNLPDVDSTLFGGLQFISSPRLTFVGTTPWIAYTRADGTGDGLRVLRLDGTSWVRVPFATPIAYGVGATEISVIDGQVVLVDYRRDNTTLVVRHDGTGWIDPFSVVVAPETRAVYRLLNRGDTTLLVSNDRVQRAVLIRRLTLR